MSVLRKRPQQEKKIETATIKTGGELNSHLTTTGCIIPATFMHRLLPKGIG